MPPQPWSEPQREIGQLTFDEAIRPPKKGLLDRYSDGSLSGPQPKLSDEFKQILPNRPPSALAKSSGVSGSLLSTFRNSNTPPAAIVADLRPLSNHLPIEIAERFITPCVELVNHYRNLQQAEANQPFSQTYTLESLIQSYSHLINDDQYIVGTDANGQPVTSEFKTSPHRFVAGEAGAGKTNFLKVLLYQLLWHNPNRTIWLADFKGGMDFQVVSAVFPNIKLITNYADFDRLLQNFWQQSEERSNDRSENIQEELAYLLQLTPEDRRRYQEEKSQKNHTVSWERNLLIIDEMAQLAHLYDDRDQKEIAKSVKANIDKVVRLGRAFKANIVFCTQSKEENVIDSNLLNNVSDRLVFRVSADTVSLRFLGSDHASKISPRTKGRGIYRGPDYAGDADDLKEIATPRFPDDDQITELNLWEELKNRSIESSEP
ncbi:FtsK/SpoIIIE domain-containing protein [Limnothrix sp. PR1529]|uniref:FtsK/SpoIIIE domain-containing protein n=1 Tax=Limnothrix sp. PR1529 TaxID=1704291 RepID=UPI00130445A8|nr:FtsK/SpoIIIE domain-containing protein [Limnothrix sp. PR1529]